MCNGYIFFSGSGQGQMSQNQKMIIFIELLCLLLHSHQFKGDRCHKDHKQYESIYTLTPHTPIQNENNNSFTVNTTCVTIQLVAVIAWKCKNILFYGLDYIDTRYIFKCKLARVFETFGRLSVTPTVGVTIMHCFILK